MSRILDLPMTHEVTYVPAGRRNSVTSKYRLPVRVEVEEAASSEFEPLLRFNAGPDVFNAAGLEPMARLMGNVVHIVRGREVYAPIDEAHFSGIMTPSISRDRDFQVPFIRTAAERLQEQAPFLETSARSIEVDGRDEAVAMAHEIASNLVFVDGKLFKRVNPPIFDLRSNYRLLTDVYQQDRPLFGLDLPCTEVGRMLPMFGLSPDLVTCSLDVPVDLAHARRALRTMLATVKMENEARVAGLAWRISHHDLSRRIDRISTPADVVGVAREFNMRFSSSPAFTDGTFPKMLLRLVEFYASYDADVVIPGEVALTFESRDDKVTLVEIDGHLYRRSDPMNAAHQSMDLDFEDMHPVVVDQQGIFWAKVQPPMLGYNGGGQTYFFQTLPKPGMGITLPATAGSGIAAALSRHAGRDIAFPAGLTVGRGTDALSAEYRRHEMTIVSAYALQALEESFSTTPFTEVIDGLAAAVMTLRRDHDDGVAVERDLADLAERGCRAILDIPKADKVWTLEKQFDLVRSVMGAVMDTVPTQTQDMDSRAPAL